MTHAIDQHRDGACVQVRAIIAGAMPGAAALLGPSEAGRLLRRPLVAALADDAPAVSGGAAAAAVLGFFERACK
jgi:hypothetical protein